LLRSRDAGVSGPSEIKIDLNGPDLGYLAVVLESSAGIWSSVAAAIGLWYARSAARSAQVTYWLTFLWVLAANGVLARVDADADLQMWRTAMGWLSPDQTWDNLDPLARANVVTPFALLVFFAAPILKAYFRRSSPTRK
jgi:hypothetical protein